MIKVDSAYWQVMLSAVAHSEPMSDDQLLALKAEIANDPAKRGYAEATDEAALLQMLGAEYTVAEDSAKEYIVKDFWPKDEFDNVILQARCADKSAPHPLTGDLVPLSLLVRLADERESGDPFLRDAAIRLPALQSSSVKGVSMKNDGVADALGYLVMKGIVSSDLLAFMTREKNPDWRSERTEIPRAWALFGDGACPTKEEVKAALA